MNFGVAQISLIKLIIVRNTQVLIKKIFFLEKQFYWMRIQYTIGLITDISFSQFFCMPFSYHRRNGKNDGLKVWIQVCPKEKCYATVIKRVPWLVTWVAPAYGAVVISYPDVMERRLEKCRHVAGLYITH